MNGRLTFTIERWTFRPGAYANSPPVFEWITLGTFKADTTQLALSQAIEQCGNEPALLRVSGVSFVSREP